MNFRRMSSKGNSENAAALRNLLSSWGLEELHGHLRDEGINIEELEMMRPHHLNELLRSFKLGIRIRFEHHFEKWRHSIFKPMGKNYENLGVSTESAAEVVVSREEKQNVCQAPSDEIQIEQPENKSNDIEPKPPEFDHHRHHHNYHQSTEEEAEAERKILRNALKRKGTESSDCSNINIIKILKSFGRQGTLLLITYNKNHGFQLHERNLLIKLLVTYFVINNYHLSLNTSYILEDQILKYFPTERLEYYRTEKRGKIYSKFGNMRRKNKTTSDSNVSSEYSVTNNVENEIEIANETSDAVEQDYRNLPLKSECVLDEQESTSY